MDTDAARPLGKAENARRGDPRVAAHWVAVEKGVPALAKQLWARRLCVDTKGRHRQRFATRKRR